MTDYIQIAIRHEAGHSTAALCLGFPIQRVSVTKGIPFAEVILDSPERTNQERFIFLAAGIAGEQFFYGRYDPGGCGKDAAMISEKDGHSIDTYLPDALRIMKLNESLLRRFVGELTCRMLDELASESFAAGGSLDERSRLSFDLLSSEDIQRIWRETGTSICNQPSVQL